MPNAKRTHKLIPTAETPWHTSGYFGICEDHHDMAILADGRIKCYRSHRQWRERNAPTLRIRQTAR